MEGGPVGAGTLAQSLLGSVGVAVAVLDRKGRILSINPCLERISGYASADVRGKDWFATFVPEAQRETVRGRFLDALGNVNLGAHLAPVRTRDGRIRELQWVVDTLRDVMANPVGLTAVAVDVTEHAARRPSESEHDLFLQNFIDAIPTPLYYKDMEGRYLGCNRAFAEFLGRTREQIIGKTVHELVPREYAEVFHTKDQGLLSSPGRQSYESFMLRADGSRREVQFDKATFLGPDGRLGGIIGSIFDITDRKKAEAALRESEANLRAIINSISTAIILIEAETHRIVTVNAVALKLIGASREQVVGMVCHKFICPAERGSCPVTDMQQEVDSSERELVRIDGQRVPVLKTVRRIVLGGRKLLMESIIDITDRKRMEEELRSLSLVDELTGLYNRRGFMTLAAQQLRVARRENHSDMLAFLDMDDLKGINDALGHHMGDRALAELAAVLRQTVRESDIAARLSGDEFSVLLTGATEAQGDGLLQRLQQSLDRRNGAGDLPFTLAVSTGMVRFDPETPETLDELLRRADQSMYEQKRRKGRRVGVLPGANAPPPGQPA
jgi:diguanylate cyclase (GGDEF)-like protein/PAS domain S-box-containing protein